MAETNVQNLSPALQKTLKQYNAELAKCRALFMAKTQDYGTAWRVLRLPALTDQLYIKAKRLQTLDILEKAGEKSKINEPAIDEWIGLINYSLLALIQIQLIENKVTAIDLGYSQTLSYYDEAATKVRNLMINKNSDYGEAWRSMRVSSFIDLIIMKLLRIKQIEDNAGATLVSEGVAAGYADIMNYALFALIKLTEAEAS